MHVCADTMHTSVFRPVRVCRMHVCLCHFPALRIQQSSDALLVYQASTTTPHASYSRRAFSALDCTPHHIVVKTYSFILPAHSTIPRKFTRHARAQIRPLSGKTVLSLSLPFLSETDRNLQRDKG
jgi:hypothetical protein